MALLCTKKIYNADNTYPHILIYIGMYKYCETSRKLIFCESAWQRTIIYTIRKRGCESAGCGCAAGGGGSSRTGGPDGVRPFSRASVRLYHMLATKRLIYHTTTMIYRQRGNPYCRVQILCNWYPVKCLFSNYLILNIVHL